MIFNFLWGSKLETISRATLPTPLLEGSLGLIDIISKSKALKLSTLVRIICRPHHNGFFLQKYFVGSQLVKFRPEWAHLKDNYAPSAIAPSSFYSCCLEILRKLVTHISDVTSFQITSKDCYGALLKDNVTKPIVPVWWSVSGAPRFNSD